MSEQIGEKSRFRFKSTLPSYAAREKTLVAIRVKWAELSDQLVDELIAAGFEPELAHEIARDLLLEEASEVALVADAVVRARRPQLADWLAACGRTWARTQAVFAGVIADLGADVASDLGGDDGRH